MERIHICWILKKYSFNRKSTNVCKAIKAREPNVLMENTHFMNHSQQKICEAVYYTHGYMGVLLKTTFALKRRNKRSIWLSFDKTPWNQNRILFVLFFLSFLFNLRHIILNLNMLFFISSRNYSFKFSHLEISIIAYIWHLVHAKQPLFSIQCEQFSICRQNNTYTTEQLLVVLRAP